MAFLFAIQAKAQSDTNGVIVHKDPRIEQLVKKQIDYNEVATRDARRYVQGYRILVMSTNDRAKAVNAKTKIYQEYPDLKSYLSYQAPFFKLKVGNFKEHKDAEDFLHEIEKIFPTGTYIVRDVIEVNPDKSDAEN
ncbi:MAG: SPOR domain-containing protein [Ginsengibacter sp.]